MTETDTAIITPLAAAFASFDAQASEYRTQAMSIIVTSEDDRQGMASARALRLKLKGIRVDAEKLRKKIKADALEYGRQVDGAYKRIESVIEPCEAHLEEQEKFAERAEAARRAALVEHRNKALSLYNAAGMVAGLDTMTDEQFAATLDTYRLAQEAQERAAKEVAEAEAARFKSEAEERERQKAENARLAKEAAEAKAERDRIEAAARAEREAHEAALKAERDKAAKLAAEREARDKAERDRVAEEAKAAATAAAAPDAAKLRALATAISNIDRPTMATEAGNAAMMRASKAINNAALAVMNEADSLR